MNGLKNDVERIKKLASEAGDLSAYKMWLPNIREEYLALKQQEADAAQELTDAKNFEPEEEQAEEIEIPEKYQKALEREGEIRSFIEYWESQDAMPEETGEADDLDENSEVEEQPETPDDIEPTDESGEPDTFSEDKYIDARREWEEKKGEVLIEDVEDEEIYKSLDQINSMSLAEKLTLYKESKDNLNDINQ